MTLPPPEAAEVLRVRLAALERELHEVWRALARAPGERLEGTFLLVAAANRRFLLSAGTVAEVCPLVATTAVVAGPPWMLGTFLWRGVQAHLIDLGGRCAGLPSAPAIDAQIAVVIGSTPVGVLVDRVERLVEHPVLLGARAPEGTRDTVVFSEVDGAPVPLLSAAAPLRWLSEALG